MTPVKLTTLRDIRNWDRPVTELVEVIGQMSLADILACTNGCKVTSTLSSYLHFEGSVLPNYQSIGGLPREVALEMKECFKRLRKAQTHRVLQDEYRLLMSLYDKVPATATGRARDIYLARNRPDLVRIIDFGVTVHRKLHANLMAIPDETKRIEMYGIARGMLVNHRTIPMLETAASFHAKMLAACDVMATV